MDWITLGRRNCFENKSLLPSWSIRKSLFSAVIEWKFACFSFEKKMSGFQMLWSTSGDTKKGWERREKCGFYRWALWVDFPFLWTAIARHSISCAGRMWSDSPYLSLAIFQGQIKQKIELGVEKRSALFSCDTSYFQLFKYEFFRLWLSTCHVIIWRVNY